LAKAKRLVISAYKLASLPRQWVWLSSRKSHDFALEMAEGVTGRPSAGGAMIDTIRQWLDSFWQWFAITFGAQPNANVKQWLEFGAAAVGVFGGTVVMYQLYEIVRIKPRERAEAKKVRAEQMKAAEIAEQREVVRQSRQAEHANAQLAKLESIEQKIEQFAITFARITTNIQNPMLFVDNKLGDRQEDTECFDQNIELGARFVDQGNLHAARVMFEAALNIASYKLSDES
jgi:hypothetical protein